MPSDDLNDLERRLGQWRPAEAGLDADAMLFAAGRAAGKPRLLRLALAGCLAALVVALSGWAWERAERRSLAEQLRRRPPGVSGSAVPPEAAAYDEPGPSSFLTAHRALEHGLDAWPPLPIPPPSAPSPSPPPLEVGRRGALLDP
jgi:hypothetical protein